MAIRFTCPKCGAELNVKDELAGKLGKCPACKNAVTVPRLARARQEVEEIEEVEEVSEADYVDEDDAPRNRRSSDVRRSRDDDYDDKPRRSRRRDEDDYDDDEPRSRRGRGRRDDDDNRPSRRSGSSRRRRDDDDEDEDLSPEEVARRKKQQAKKERAGWRRANTGMFLTFISMCMYAGAIGFALLGFIIAGMMSSSRSGGGELLKLFGFGTVLLLLPTYILAVVGLGFTVTSTTRNGAMGLAIASTATGGIAALCYLFLMFKLFDTPQGLGAWFGFLLLFVNLNPLGPLMESSGLGAVFFLFANIVSDSKFLLYVLPLMEVSRLTLFALYIWAAGRCLRDQETSSAGFVLGIVVPSGCFGAGLILWLIGFAMKNVTSVWPGLIIGTFYGMALIGLLVWYIFVVGNARTMLDHV